MNRIIEFSVEVIVERSADFLRINGRSCKGVIHIGDVFTSVYTYKKPDVRYSPDLIPVNVSTVHLEVVRILMYYRLVDALYPGSTGQIVFKGDIYAELVVGYLGGVMAE